MNRRVNEATSQYVTKILPVISIGFFFILIGLLFLYASNTYHVNLVEEFTDFFRDFTLIQVPNTYGFVLPSPASPHLYLQIYHVITLFSLVWGIFQIFVLAIRFLFNSPLEKIAETLSNGVFWLSTSYLISTFLNGQVTTHIWFLFWSTLLTVLGISFILRGLILSINHVKT